MGLSRLNTSNVRSRGKCRRSRKWWEQRRIGRAAGAAISPREGGSSPAEVAALPSPPTNAVLSTFLAPPASSDDGIGSVGPTSSSSDHQGGDDAGDGAVGGGESASTIARVERLERVLGDLKELQEIVEQIDMSDKFAKIGEFGRLIVPIGPGYRPEKTEFSAWGGHRALLDVALGCDDLGVAEDGDTATPSSSALSRLSFALHGAILHALRCSVMGPSAGVDVLCEDARFKAFLAGALAQQGRGVSIADKGASTEEGGKERENEEGAKLRNKAAFVLERVLAVEAPGLKVRQDPDA